VGQNLISLEQFSENSENLKYYEIISWTETGSV